MLKGRVINGTLVVRSYSCEGIKYTGKSCSVCCRYFGRDREMIPATAEDGTPILVCNSNFLDPNPCGMICSQDDPEILVNWLFEERIAWFVSQETPKVMEVP